MSEDADRIKVTAKFGAAEVEVKGGRLTVESVDKLAASLFDIAAFLPRLAANYTNEIVDRQKRRYRSVAEKTIPHIEVVPPGHRIEPSDKIKRAIVVGAAVEDDPDIQELWARFLARAADAREEEPELLLAAAIEKMTKEDLVFLESLRESLIAEKKRQIAKYQESVINLKNNVGEGSERMKSGIVNLLENISRHLRTQFHEIVSNNVTDRSLALGFVAPVSDLDISPIQKFRSDLKVDRKERNRGALYLDSVKEATRENLDVSVDTLADAVESILDEMTRNRYRLTDLGNRLYELSQLEPVSNSLSVSEIELLERATAL